MPDIHDSVLGEVDLQPHAEVWMVLTSSEGYGDAGSSRTRLMVCFMKSKVIRI